MAMGLRWLEVEGIEGRCFEIREEELELEDEASWELLFGEIGLKNWDHFGERKKSKDEPVKRIKMEVDLEVSKEVEVEEDDITWFNDKARDGASLSVSCACQLVSEKAKNESIL